jgi:hypothetical protein
MVTMIEELIEIAKVKHEIRFPVDNSIVLNELEIHETCLPSDVIRFYELCDGGVFWKDGKNRFEILGIESLCGDDFFFLPRNKSSGFYAGANFVICELDDGNAVGFAKGYHRSMYPIFFLDHESYPNYDIEADDIVATSFSEFLERLLHCEGEWWW